MKEQYQLTTDELKKEFNLTDFTQGLTSAEVKQKLASDGQNGYVRIIGVNSK